jgi:transglutaminase-like putative cysteine protease
VDSSSSFGKTLLKAFLVTLGVASCFCCLGIDLLLELGSELELDSLSGPPADLGSALIPLDTLPHEVQTYEWSVSTLSPRRHQLRYGLGTSLATKVEREHLEFGRRLNYRSVARGKFTFRSPPECQDDLRCVYDELMRSNARPVRELGERFAEYIRTQQLSQAQAADLIVGFVQRIRYELPPDGVPFGVYPPALVPARDGGDCDSKAVLTVMLLRQVGIDAVILYSAPLAHAAVGVGLPGGGTALRYGGRSYRYTEITNEGWPIGTIPPDHNKLHLWTVLPPPPAARSR